MSRTSASAMALSIALSLACGGGGGGSGADAIEIAPATAPEPVTQAVQDGLGGVLGFPLMGGEVRLNEATKVHVLHISAFDAGLYWEAYSKHLEDAGWVRTPTRIPPFEGLFTKDKQRLVVRCELKGSSVWVRAEYP